MKSTGSGWPRRALAATLFAVAASCARPAVAWDPETHVSIVKAAFAISPAAEARVPREHREAFFSEVASPDSFDSICRYHNGPAARVDPCLEAEKVQAYLAGAGSRASAYARTKSLGRLLHFAADAAVPTPIREGKAYTILDFFSHQDFVVFRQPRPLSLPLAGSLRQVGAGAQWPEESTSAHSYVYRRAVNLVVDVLLLLPPRADARDVPDTPDAGQVLFLVDRLRNLKGDARTDTYYVTNYEYGASGERVSETHSVREERTGSDANRADDLMTRKALQIVERVIRREEGGSSVQVLLFNNSETCQTEMSLRFKEHTFPIGGALPAGTLRVASIRLPPNVPAAALQLFSAPGTCAADRPEPGAVRTDRRIVLGLSGVPRDFVAARDVAEIRSDPGARVSALGASPYVRLNRAALDGINDGPSLARMVARVEPDVAKSLAGRLLLERLTVDASRKPWVCRLVVRNTGETGLEAVDVTLLVTPNDPAVTSTRETVRFDARSVSRGSTEELLALLDPHSGFQPAALSVVAAARASLPAARPVPVQNTIPRPARGGS